MARHAQSMDASFPGPAMLNHVGTAKHLLSAYNLRKLCFKFLVISEGIETSRCLFFLFHILLHLSKVESRFH